VRVATAAKHDVAIEVLWSGQLFVGVRWGLGEVDEVVAAIKRIRSWMLAPRTRSAKSALVSLLGVVPQGAPDFAELGAVNAWSSTRPLTLWRRRGLVELSTDVDEALSSRPDLVECPAPVALEIAASHPRPWWIGTVVSTPIGSVHRLDRRLLDEALARGVGTGA
jgi:hypothetical protein